MELVEIIVESLSAKDLLSCWAVSKNWREILNHNSFWEAICKNRLWKIGPKYLLDKISGIQIINHHHNNRLILIYLYQVIIYPINFKNILN